MSTLTRREANLFWRTLDAPHASEETDAGTLAPMRADIPRGSSGMHCCGVQWEDREGADTHRAYAHDVRPSRTY
jgi:hypothetical protein